MNVLAAQQKAQKQIRANGVLVQYRSALAMFKPNNAQQPWRVGLPLDSIAAGLNNVVADLGQDAAAIEPVTVTPDPNAEADPQSVYIVFLDAKSRGSSTQGMAAEFISGTDVVAGNKLGLLAGGQGITPKQGDQITGLIDGTEQTVTVAKFKVLAPTGVPILYTMEIEL